MPTLTIDQQTIEFEPGDTILQAALKHGVYIPHLCYQAEFGAHGSCRVCMVKVGGRYVSSCTVPASDGITVMNMTDDVQELRQQLLQMLFVEGNHVCPACEKSGRCDLQSVAEFCGMLAPSLPFQYPDRKVDATHPDFLLDFNRCINCELCVRASRDVDGKSVFAMRGRGHEAHLVVNSPDGTLGASDFASTDRAANVCPVGVILPKGKGFDAAIGQRAYDRKPIELTQVEGGQSDGR
jgi:[NiFe] hydrogenase diaphorase moiety small subunit